MRYDHKLYICLYGYTYPDSNPIMQILSKSIIKVTHSDRTHSAWGIDLSGEFKDLTSKGIGYNNVRTGENQLSELYNYVILSFPVTEEEYIAACELYKQEEKSTHYNVFQLLQIGVDKLTRKSFDASFKIPDKVQAEVCSSYVALCLAKLSWRLNKLILELFGNHKLVAPSDLLKLPGLVVVEQSLGLNFSVLTKRIKKTMWR